jgi:hypothetical protein
MFDFTLFGLLLLASMPGIFIASYRQVDTLRRTVARSKGPVPSRSNLVVLGIVQNTVLVAIAAAIGTALAPRVGLSAPIFEAIANGEPIPADLSEMVLPTIAVTVVLVVPFLLAYYGYIRPRLGKETVKVVEEIRIQLGLSGRLLFGGLVEEILTRWGLMTLFVWFGALVIDPPTAPVYWAAIVISGLLFGVGHLPGLFAAGAQKSSLLYVSAVGSNLWVSLGLGWLYWQYGLIAAVVGHMLFHLAWYPLDQRFQNS